MDRRFAFLAHPPRTVGELATALAVALPDPPGPSDRMGMVPLVSQGDAGAPAPSAFERAFVEYRWDHHHQGPVATTDALRRRDLVHYTLRFAGGRAACEAQLRALHGEPRARAKPDGKASSPYRQYGPFAVDAADRDAFVVEWFAQPPDWFADAIDASARATALRALVKELAAAQSPDDVGRIASRWPERAGIVAKGSLNPGDYWLELAPAMTARELASALSLNQPVTESTDVHQSHWRVVEAIGPKRWALKRVGAWTIEPSLTDSPRGASLAGVPAGPIARRALAAEDSVKSVRLARAP